MSRKKTIIISVLVNAALLAILFITALTSKNKHKNDQKIQNTALLEETTIDAKELFSPSSDAKDNLTISDLAANGMPAQNNNVANVATNEQNPQSVSQEYRSILDEKNSNISQNETITYKLPEIESKQDVNPISELPLSVSTIEVKVKKGDTLEKIARRNKVKVSEIIKMNNLSNSFLKIGQTLQLPAKNKDVTSKIASNSSTETKSSLAEYYTIKIGDNPYTIAIKHNLKPNQLLKLNNLDEKKARKLKPGDKLRIR
jgi:LysM repeat protein